MVRINMKGLPVGIRQAVLDFFKSRSMLCNRIAGLNARISELEESIEEAARKYELERDHTLWLMEKVERDKLDRSRVELSETLTRIIRKLDS